MPEPRTLSRASIGDTLQVVARIGLPTLAKGPLIRRPWAMAAAAALDLDQGGIRLLQRLRQRYGHRPLLLRWAGREQAIVLDPDDAFRILEDTPSPFLAATSEKRAALRHFEPKAVLASRGPEREDRRRFNEAVLDTACPIHRHAPEVLRAVDEELRPLREAQSFDWDDFAACWARLSRRIALGAGAADDEALSRDLSGLRYDANWAFLKPRRDVLRHRFFVRLQAHLDRAEAGSLAADMKQAPQSCVTAPADQAPQWLFAFDAAGMAVARALAVIATHREIEDRVRAEMSGNADLPYLRACVLESVRLWPTTPMIFRQSDRATQWGDTELPAGTDLLIWVKFLHRDDTRWPYANRFVPELWLRDGPARLPFVPFSHGPGVCPARNLVQLVGSAALATLLRGRSVRLRRPSLLVPSRLPATLNVFALRFESSEALA